MDRHTELKKLDWFSSELLTELIEELREAGYNIGISQYIAAHDLVLSLISQNLLSTPDRLGSFLAPILCSSSVEQQDFQQHFRNWLERVETKHSLSSAQATKPDSKLEAELKQIGKESRKIKLPLIAVFSLVLCIGVFIFSRSQSPTAVNNTPENTPRNNTPQTGEPATLDREQLESELRSSSESETSLNWQITLVSILLISGVAYFGSKKLWWSRQAHLFLQRRETSQTPRLEQIYFPNLGDSLFKPLLVLKPAQALRHRIRVSANTLDINKTIHGSLQNGGWFTPSYGYRQVFPEYLFLIDCASVWDHQAELVEQLTHQLRQSGVYITTYFFDEDPRVCFSSNERILPQRLPELSARYQQHRLVIFADAEIFSNLQTAGYAPWVEQLFSWQNPVAITPKPLGSWGSNEFLLAQSLTLLPLSDTGIQVLGQVMQGGSATYRASPEVSTSMPTILKSRPKRWIERNPPTPEQAKTILVGLRTYLGNDGFYWLAACAVFPQLRWHITLYLGDMLKAQEGKTLLESCSLPNLARLPWYRYGYMPDWFRGYLIETLTQQQQKEVRLVLEKLLATAISGEEETASLKIATQDQSVLPQLTKPILRILSKQAPENTAFKDYLFLDFMFEKSQLAVEVPPEIVPILRQYSQTNVSKRRKVRILKIIGIVAGLALVSTFSYYGYRVAVRNEQHETMLNSADKKFYEGNYRGAIADYTQAIEIYPNSAEAYYNRGWAYYELGEYQREIADYTQVIELDPNDARAYYSRGWAYYDLKEYRKAIADLNRAIEIYPNSAEAYYHRGNAYYELEEYRKAIADYTQAIEIDPNHVLVYNNRGLAYRGLEEHQKAIADFTRVIEIDPNYALAYDNRGLAYRRLGDSQKALEDYQKAAPLYQQQGDTEDYQDVLDRIEQLQQQL